MTKYHVTPKISVLISNYNQKDLVLKALDALELQTYKDFEIIIGDDGSRHEERFTDYVKGKKHLYAIFQKDQGYRLATIRNKQVQKAKGEYLVFLDGDCIPGNALFLETIYNYFRRAYEVIGFDKATYREGVFMDRISDEWQSTSFMSWWNYRGGAFAITKKLFEDLGGFDPAFDGQYGMEDSDLILKALKQKEPMTNTPDIWVDHEWHDPLYQENPHRNMDLLLEKHGRFIVWGWQGVKK